MTSMSLWYQTKHKNIYNKLKNASTKFLKTYKNIILTKGYHRFDFIIVNYKWLIAYLNYES